MHATLRSVNAGRVRERSLRGRSMRTAIDKQAVDGPVEVDAEGLVVDEQADRRHHGGPEQALYAYATEDYDHWVEQLGRALVPGQFGENLTTAGVDVNGARIGERWRVGGIVVAVTGPRIPCSTFAGHIDEPAWVRRFTAALRPGAYLRVVETGTVRAGDPITVVARPDHDVTVADAFRIHVRDRHEVARLVDLPGLVTPLAQWAREHARGA